ncbi:MAG: Asp-tRNA(Asn)/Glu-tRNA(Gln) amidotransferase subunit GatC [Chitinispirillales bacterium]|jgi:aspartyl-tRNA(Asn)/glutamyl-tRNA(Gln) amidotransferase subunit C|nr:Asp-tRNA(Asn)/Glu-tRNA(Gln) amidotransferase subunit GatC [Chitinispirillales bacterium]
MIDKSQVLHVAALARLDLPDAEIPALTAQMASILEYVDQLDAADIEGVEPTCYVIPPHDPTRGDDEVPSLAPEALLANGPSVKKGHFAVPKVIGGA